MSSRTEGSAPGGAQAEPSPVPSASPVNRPSPADRLSPAHRPSPADRAARVWRALPHERRLAALAALGLFVSLFLPWYQETVIARGLTSLRSVSASLTGWGAFSFVEAAVLLVAAAVLVLLFVRAEGRAFHVPGGDGGVITTAGAWVCLLIVWRMFDKQGTTGHGLYETTSGIEWGIFVALAVGALMVYAGTRIRLAHEPEPPLPGERQAPSRRSGRKAGFMRGRRGRAAGAGSAADAGVTAESGASDLTRPMRAPRAPEMELDETWTDRAPARPRADPDAEAGGSTSTSTSAASAAAAESAAAPAVRPAAAAPAARPAPAEPAKSRRRRPRSIGAPEPAVREDPVAPPDPGDQVRTLRLKPEPGGGGSPDRPAERRLDPREIQELEIAEPPISRLGRAERQPEPSPEPDDQLTLRLDRPD